MGARLATSSLALAVGLRRAWLAQTRRDAVCCWPRRSAPVLVARARRLDWRCWSTLEQPTLADVADVGLGLLVLGCLVWAAAASLAAPVAAGSTSTAEAELFRRVVDVTAFVVFAAGPHRRDRARRRRELGLPGHVSRLQRPGLLPFGRDPLADIQLYHRLLAYVALALVAWVAVEAFRTQRGVRRVGRASLVLLGGHGRSGRSRRGIRLQRQSAADAGAAHGWRRRRPGRPRWSWLVLSPHRAAASPRPAQRRGRDSPAATSPTDCREASVARRLRPADQAARHVAAAGDDRHGDGHRRARHADLGIFVCDAARRRADVRRRGRHQPLRRSRHRPAHGPHRLAADPVRRHLAAPRAVVRHRPGGAGERRLHRLRQRRSRACWPSLGLLGYVFIYTLWLKRSTPSNIVIGGAAGAIPPLVGWAAVTNEISSLTAWYLFAIIFFWTPPHFWALSLLIRKHYERAGVPMLPVVRGEDETRRQIVLYSVLLVVLTLVLSPFGMMGGIYFAAAARPRRAVHSRRRAPVAPGDARRPPGACTCTRSCICSRCSPRWRSIAWSRPREEVQTHPDGARRQSADLGRQKRHRHGQAQEGQGADLRQVVLPGDSRRRAAGQSRDGRTAGVPRAHGRRRGHLRAGRGPARAGLAPEGFAVMRRRAASSNAAAGPLGPLRPSHCWPWRVRLASHSARRWIWCPSTTQQALVDAGRGCDLAGIHMPSAEHRAVRAGVGLLHPPARA